MPSPSHDIAREQERQIRFRDFLETLVYALSDEVSVTPESVVRSRNVPKEFPRHWFSRLQCGDESMWLQLLFLVWQREPRSRWYYRLKYLSPFANEHLMFVPRFSAELLEAIGDMELKLRQYIGEEPLVLRLKESRDLMQIVLL